MDHIKSGLEYGVAMDKIADSVLLDAYSEICNILDTRVWKSGEEVKETVSILGNLIQHL